MMAALYAALVIMALRRRNAAGLMVGYALLVFGLAAGGLLAMGWKDALLALDYIAHRPWFGYGFGAFWREQNPEAQVFWTALGFKTPHAHNSWLELALGLGIVGTGLVALAWLVGFYRTLRVAVAPHAEHVAFCAALLAAIFFENLSEY